MSYPINEVKMSGWNSEFLKMVTKETTNSCVDNTKAVARNCLKATSDLSIDAATDSCEKAIRAKIEIYMPLVAPVVTPFVDSSANNVSACAKQSVEPFIDTCVENTASCAKKTLNKATDASIDSVNYCFTKHGRV